MRRKEPFFWFTLACGAVIMAYILIPLVELMRSPSIPDLWASIQDKDVARSIRLSIYTAGSAATLSFISGPPPQDLIKQPFR